VKTRLRPFSDKAFHTSSGLFYPHIHCSIITSLSILDHLSTTMTVRVRWIGADNTGEPRTNVFEALDCRRCSCRSEARTLMRSTKLKGGTPRRPSSRGALPFSYVFGYEWEVTNHVSAQCLPSVASFCKKTWPQLSHPMTAIHLPVQTEMALNLAVIDIRGW